MTNRDDDRNYRNDRNNDRDTRHDDDRWMNGREGWIGMSDRGNGMGGRGMSDRDRYGMDREGYGSMQGRGGWHDGRGMYDDMRSGSMHGDRDRSYGSYGQNRDMEDREGYGRNRDDRTHSMNRNQEGRGSANSYERGLGGMGAYNPDRERGNREGMGMGMRAEHRGYDQGGGYRTYGDYPTGRGGGATTAYSDRDMGNLERDPYGMGSTMRGSMGEQDYGRSRGYSEGYGGNSGQSYGGTSTAMQGGITGGMYRYGQDDQRLSMGRGQSGHMSQSGQMGQMSQGRHYGRGPKNYQRSDDRIREEVSEHLTYHHEIDATDIEVQVQNGEVTLTGTVTDRWQKRMAEDIAEEVRGVRDVHNHIRVQQNQNFSQGQAGSGTMIATPGHTGEMDVNDTGSNAGSSGSPLSTTAMSGGDSTNMTTTGTTMSSEPGDGSVSGNSTNNNR